MATPRESVWGRRVSGGQIDPLVAATLASWAADRATLHRRTSGPTVPDGADLAALRVALTAAHASLAGALDALHDLHRGVAAALVVLERLDTQ